MPASAATLTVVVEDRASTTATTSASLATAAAPSRPRSERTWWAAWRWAGSATVEGTLPVDDHGTATRPSGWGDGSDRAVTSGSSVAAAARWV